jgi:energy-converting hydrogenase Eha subunit C
MNDLIAWLCIQLGGSGCYLLSPVEKMTYVAGLAFGLVAAVLLLYGALVRIFTR